MENRSLSRHLCQGSGFSPARRPFPLFMGHLGARGRVGAGIVTRAIACWLGLVSIVSTLAEPMRFRVDPARSELRLGGVVQALGSTVTLQEQGEGGLVAPCEGVLNVRFEEGFLTFLEGSELVPQEDRVWKPALDGEDGEAPASFGIQATLRVLIFTALAHAASRDVVLDVTSPPLALDGDTFEAGDLVLAFAEGRGSAVDFRVTGAVEESGRQMAAGSLTNRLAGLGRLEQLDGVLTLRLPVDASYGLELETSVGDTAFLLEFTGEVVATLEMEVEPELPAVQFTLPTVPGGPFQLSFPDTLFKLQHTPSLHPPDWQDFATESPVEVVPEGIGGFFRVLPIEF